MQARCRLVNQFWSTPSHGWRNCLGCGVSTLSRRRHRPRWCSGTQDSTARWGWRTEPIIFPVFEHPAGEEGSGALGSGNHRCAVLIHEPTASVTFPPSYPTLSDRRVNVEAPLPSAHDATVYARSAKACAVLGRGTHRTRVSRSLSSKIGDGIGRSTVKVVLHLGSRPENTSSLMLLLVTFVHDTKLPAHRGNQRADGRGSGNAAALVLLSWVSRRMTTERRRVLSAAAPHVTAAPMSLGAEAILNRRCWP